MEALAGSGVWFGMVIGFIAGAAFQSARHAVQNLRKTQESIPGLKKTASAGRIRAALWLLAIASYAVIVLLAVVNLR
jgi:cell division septal protein FtsQ